MEGRLIAYIFGVALLVSASVAAIANQSGTFVGVHEIPPFVCNRVELVRGLSVAPPGGDDVGTSGSNRIARGEALVTDSRSCAVDNVTPISAESGSPKKAKGK